MYRNNTLFVLLVATMAGLPAGCDKKKDDPHKKYQIDGVIQVDGRARTYWLNLPPGFDQGKDYPLVIALHGGGGWGKQFETSTGLTVKADAEKFIVVYPDGVKSDGPLKAQTWNAGNCCDYAAVNNINDVKFISELIDQLVAKYKVNAKRVYATGHSNGGMMSYRLACELSNKIAAIAPNSCTMVMKQPIAPTRAVPILHMHSVLDKNVPYQGGVGDGVTHMYFPPVDSVLNVWSSKNACTNTAQVVVNNASYKKTQWTNCSNNVTIQYYLTQDGGHAWPGAAAGSITGDKPSTAINANDLLWEFFKQYQLP